eukprot:879012-Amphidinium_carterae.1
MLWKAVLPTSQVSGQLSLQAHSEPSRALSWFGESVPSDSSAQSTRRELLVLATCLATYMPRFGSWQVHGKVPT